MITIMEILAHVALCRMQLKPHIEEKLYKYMRKREVLTINELNSYLIQEKQNREGKKQKQINTIENIQ